MSETEFLEDYDPTAFARLSVAVDLVLMTVRDGELVALLQQRSEHPFRGGWALPGGFVGIDESLDDAARRVLADKAGFGRGLAEGWLEQLYTFGDPARDPRMRIVTVAYFALLPAERLAETVAGRSDLMLAPLAPLAGDAPLPLAFDHAAILDHAVRRLRGKLDHAPIAFALLPPRFTLRALQDVHEAILGVSLNKPAFRRRMLDRGWIAGTGEREAGTSYRPAELYRFELKDQARAKSAALPIRP